jgi:hypothetical protein
MVEALEWYEKDFPAFVAKVLGMEQAEYQALCTRTAIFGPAGQAPPADLLIHRGRGQPALLVDFQEAPKDLDAWWADLVDKVRKLPVPPPKIDYISPEMYRQLEKLARRRHDPGIKQPNRHARRRADRSRQ